MAGIERREFLKVGLGVCALAGASALGGCSRPKASGHVVVVGGGFGGATLAKYLRLWGQQRVAVTLVEQAPAFVSCPLSNLVLAGAQRLEDLTVPYDGLRSRWGVRVIHDTVVAIDPVRRAVRLAQGGELSYDRLALSPGVDLLFDQWPGMNHPWARENILHAWKAGPQTKALRQRLEAMADGGVFAIAIPKAPFRCPPGPYERASVVAAYFKRHKPRAKVVVLDANDDIVAKKDLFTRAWQDLYPGMVEYRPGSEVKDVEAASQTAIFEFDRFRADVLNAIPPQRAAAIAADSGLKLINQRWADIDWLSMESTNTPGVHVLGDAVFSAPAMPKSGHMANQHAKLAAAAMLDLLAGDTPNPAPLVMNTCYSYVDIQSAIHIASVHQYDPASKVMQPVKGAGGVSAERSAMEAKIARGWAMNIWADMLH